MARRVDDFSFEPADAHRFAVTDRFVHMRDALCLVARRHHAAPMMLFQFGDAGGVIAVMMSDEDVGQAPTGFGESGLDRGRFRRVDGGRRPARRIVEENAEIVLQTGE